MLSSNGLGKNVNVTITESDQATISLNLENIIEGEATVTADDNGNYKGHFKQTGGWARPDNMENNELHISMKEYDLTAEGKVKEVNRGKSSLSRTFTHEFFHVLGLDHPWGEKAPEDLKGPNIKDKTIINNIQNSSENPNENLRSTSGTGMTQGQKDHIKNLKNK